MKQRNANCSFCRKSYRDVGPLVEGPGDVYICGECVELCQSIIEQEKRRRIPARSSSIGPEAVRGMLDQLVSGQEEAKAALTLGASGQHKGTDHVVLIGSSRSSKILLARALAHALEVPFAAGDASGLAKNRCGSEDVLPLLYNLLLASDFDIESAQQGVIYVDGVERQEAQVALLQFWQGNVSGPVGQLHLDIRRILFVCGGMFAGLDEAISRLGRHEEQAVSGEALVAVGVRPDLVGRFTAIARVAPLDEESLARIVHWVDLSRVHGGPA